MKIPSHIITLALAGVFTTSCTTITQNQGQGQAQKQDQRQGLTRDDKAVVEGEGELPIKPVPPKELKAPTDTEKPKLTKPSTQPTTKPATQPTTKPTTPATVKVVKPTPPKRVTPKAPGRKVHSVSVNGPYVALTFDDGPHPTHTPRIINILNKYGAKGTFYVLGERVKRNPAILSKAVASGHEIGVHTWNHPSLTRIDRAAVNSQMDRSVAAIRSAIGRSVPTMRPPYGAINTDLVNYFSQKYGMSTIMWSVDTNDWKRPGVSVVTSRAVNQAKNGSIILLHDIHAPSAAAVEGIVKGLQARGFKLVTVSELLRRARSEARGATAAAPKAATPAAPAPPVPSATASL